MLFSFSTIILSILFIVIAYVVFTNLIDMRSKIIIIILISILGIYLYLNLDIFDTNTLIASTSDATKETIVQKDKITQTMSNYSLSTWIYIDDWNYRFGEKKTVIKRENADKKSNPHIYLDEYQNNLILEFYIKDVSGQDICNNDYIEAKEWCETITISNELLECAYNSDTSKYEPVISGVKCVDNVYQCIDGTVVDIDASCNAFKNEQKHILKNIPIQKWFHIVYAFGENHTDIYLNGKLVDTKTFDGVQYLDLFDGNDFYLCSDGGYSGNISRTLYYDSLISPEKAYSIYKEGFNNVVVGSLFSKYNASITFYEDANERAKYYIV